MENQTVKSSPSQEEAVQTKENKFRSWFKETTHNFYIKSQQIGFWFIIIFLSGFLSGVYFSRIYIGMQIKDAIQLKGFINAGKVYEIREDPLRSEFRKTDVDEKLLQESSQPVQDNVSDASSQTNQVPVQHTNSRSNKAKAGKH